MTRPRSRVGAAGVVWIALALSGCRTTSATVPFTPLPVAAVAVVSALDGLERAASERGSLRADTRVRIAGATGEAFTRQLLLLESPAKLRLEVVGVLDQRILVLATDGDEYDLYRAETRRIERGAVHDALLADTVGLPVTPDEAVRLLLAVPRSGAGELRAGRSADGRVRLDWSDRRIEFDADGRLASVSLGDRARVRYEDWRAADDDAWFPHRISIDAPAVGIAARVEFRSVELDPAVPPHLFRLGARGVPSGDRTGIVSIDPERAPTVARVEGESG